LQEEEEEEEEEEIQFTANLFISCKNITEQTTLKIERNTI
jgi:hypothetical protein